MSRTVVSFPSLSFDRSNFSFSSALMNLRMFFQDVFLTSKAFVCFCVKFGRYGLIKSDIMND